MSIVLVYVCKSFGHENFINMRMHACMRAERACARMHAQPDSGTHTHAMQCNAAVDVCVYGFMLRSTLDECV